MLALVGSLTLRKPRRSLSHEFQHAFANEVLKTERLRIIALIIVATVVALTLGLVDMIAPQVLDRIWRGHFLFLVTSYVVFVLFEASVLALITRQIKHGGDVPQLRRYFGAFIERACRASYSGRT
jgi:adenylate cyclase